MRQREFAFHSLALLTFPLALLLVGSWSVTPLAAQIPVAIHGRVEDSTSRLPIPGVRVFAADSSSSVLTDSAGSFVVVVPDQDSLVVFVDRAGDEPQRFDLTTGSRLRQNVLLLDTRALAIEGVTAVAEAALATLQRNLKRRRDSYAYGAVRVYDRPWLDRFGAPGGSVFELVQQRERRIRPCRMDDSALCIPGRGRTPQHPDPEARLLVCVDGWVSTSPIAELGNLPIQSVALVEVLSRNRIAVYTQLWMLQQARLGKTSVVPLDFPG